MRLSTIAAILAVSSPLSMRAQEPAVNVQLRCAAPCTFRQGESIWVNLDFTATVPNRFKVLTNYTDREKAPESFSVIPQEGASDPLQPYLPALKPMAGSLHLSYTTLVKIPAAVRLNLNQFVRFDRPGLYRVSVASTRASHLNGGPVEARSNEVIVEILPADSQWQEEQLAHIRRVLGSGALPGGEIPNEVRDLCNLGTEDAAIEMARQIGGDRRTFPLYEFGLIRSPYHSAALRELQRLSAGKPPSGLLARLEAILAAKP